ncbi:MAG: OmpA family protein [Gammaproteobacteria bacterium]|nr:OmpA family protein [Gammaproteobacteria bacterium]
MTKKIILLTSVLFLSSCAGTSIQDLGDKFLDLINPSDPAVEVEDLSDSVLMLDDESGSFSGEDLGDAGMNAGEESSGKTEAEIVVGTLADAGVSFVLYFSYDDAEIDEEATQVIIDHANFMKNNPAISLRLEGHADERGTREYNLALGENRALSVKEVLGLYGLENRVEVVSFGEEQPIAFTHDEDSWQKNRRVEFIYQ